MVMVLCHRYVRLVVRSTHKKCALFHKTMAPICAITSLFLYIPSMISWKKDKPRSVASGVLASTSVAYHSGIMEYGKGKQCIQRIDKVLAHVVPIYMVAKHPLDTTNQVVLLYSLTTFYIRKKYFPVENLSNCKWHAHLHLLASFFFTRNCLL